MFGTIKRRIYVINIIFLIFTFSLLALAAITFTTYTLRKDSDGNSLYYKFNSMSEIENIISQEDKILNITTQNGLVMPIVNDLLYKNIVFLTFLFFIAIFLLTLIYLNIYNHFIMPLLDVESSNAKEFIQINKNIRRRETEIYNQREDLYTINKYITHEFKNSLMVLKGKYYINKDEALEYIDEINKQIEDLNALTTNKVDIVEIDLLLICAEVIEAFDQEIEFIFDNDDFNILGTSTLIYRVLYNIIENAFKYGAQKVWIKVKKHSDNVICEIENNGPKMDEKKLDDIFKMNYRINKLNKNGSGIGLSLVKNVMNILKGSFYVASNEEKTTFYLSFIASDSEHKNKNMEKICIS